MAQSISEGMAVFSLRDVGDIEEVLATVRGESLGRCWHPFRCLSRNNTSRFELRGEGLQLPHPTWLAIDDYRNAVLHKHTFELDQQHLGSQML